MWVTVMSVMAFVVSVFTVIAAFGFIYRQRTKFTTSMASMKNKTVIITGSSAGIGKEAAWDLALRGARVILACRNLKKAADVADFIKSTTGNKEVLVRHLDTSSQASVRMFADKILAEEHRIDVLVLNAGIGGMSKRTLTTDGLEITMATNHFGHFLLANRLLGLLKESSPSRVIVTSSMAHSYIKTLDPRELNYENGKYWQMHAYSQSKACNILFAHHLADILKGTGVVVNALCPGLVATEIFKKCDGFIIGKLYRFLAPIMGKTTQQGAQTIVHLAVSKEDAAITGKFFENCKVSDNISTLVCDAGLAKKVWEASEAYVDLKPEETFY
ncbi:retinol dehydrogenase 12-like [Homarus americanus]|uniref:retinol dehydrogenase 12-like n=1 Tax=Homarus americanus TaxID=6706 RepID=UPI001C447F56|nr:retinol dehydrogenase 12-like [Homarus americanus]